LSLDETLPRSLPLNGPPSAKAGAKAETSKPDFRLRLILPAGAVTLWEVVSRLDIIPSYNFPPPSAVLSTLIDLARTGELWWHLSISTFRVLAGFVIGTSLGTALGALTGFSVKWQAILDGTIQALRSIPIIAWVPLFILWLGIDEAPKISLIAIGAFFPVYLNLFVGLRGVDRKLIEVGRANRMKGWRLIRSVLLPSALPSYFVGLRTGMGLAWMFVAAAELLGASRGIGYLLLDGQNLGRPAVVIGSMILFGICGKGSDFVLAALSARLLRWQDTATNNG
jgi:sulfonate transport system permease protein